MSLPLITPLLFLQIPIRFPFPAEPPIPTRTAIVALGKSAAFMTRRFLDEHPSYRTVPLLVVTPEGIDLRDQELPVHAQIVYSTHPHLTERSFMAGHALSAFLRRHAQDTDAVIALLSGGASALVEEADDPAAVMAEYQRLLYSGLPIQEINRRRIALSRIKGGKLTDRLPEARWITFVMSDIPSPDGYRLVGSMPTFRENSPRHLLIPVADGAALHDFCARTIREQGYRIVWEEQFGGGTVETWCDAITKASKCLAPREALLFTGEPTIAVTVPFPGCGGRMAHLALLLADSLPEHLTLYALSSDGIDGDSPYAGVVFSPEERQRFDRTIISDHLARFDAYSFFKRYECAIQTGYTGVNLNDVVVVTRE